MYGPLPADVALRNDSALSLLSAPTDAVPPCALTSFELTMPSDVFVTITGIAGFGVAERRTTPYLPVAWAATPARRKDGIPFTLLSRLKRYPTSADTTARSTTAGMASARGGRGGAGRMRGCTFVLPIGGGPCWGGMHYAARPAVSPSSSMTASQAPTSLATVGAALRQVRNARNLS